jgi:ferredoxin
VERPVLGCAGDVEVQGHARVTCLAALASEQLAALAVFVPHGVQLNGTRCQGCPRGEAIARLRDRLGTLGTLAAAVHLVQDPGELEYRAPTLDRRSFFRSLGRGTAARASRLVWPERNDNAEGRSKKILPRRRVLLNAALDQLPDRRRERLRDAFGYCVSFSAGCTACPRCVAMCPTGALVRMKKEGRRTMGFDAARCTGCGVCVAFCPFDALSLDSPGELSACAPPTKPNPPG